MRKNLSSFLSCLLGVTGIYIIYYFFGLNRKLEQIAKETKLEQFNFLENDPLLWMYIIGIIVIVVIGLLDFIFTTKQNKDDYTRRKDKQRRKYSV